MIQGIQIDFELARRPSGIGSPIAQLGLLQNRKPARHGQAELVAKLRRVLDIFVDERNCRATLRHSSLKLMLDNRPLAV